MKRLTKKEVARYRGIFGAGHTARVHTRSTQGPLGFVALAEEVRHRLRSSGGRPTMPEWDIKRPIPLRHEDWENLIMQGEQLGISPAQCAALLIERGLAALGSAKRRKRGGNRLIGALAR